MMSLRTARWVLLVYGLHAAASIFAQQGDPTAGELKAGQCAGCHGIPDYRNGYPTYHVPKLGGQYAEYIVSALQQYKSGARMHPTMNSIATNLSDQDIADLAAFLSMREQGGNR